MRYFTNILNGTLAYLCFLNFTLDVPPIYYYNTWLLPEIVLEYGFFLYYGILVIILKIMNV